MTLRMEPANPVAGTPVRFVLEASPPTGLPCCSFQLLPGDATPISASTTKPDPTGCANPTTGPQRTEAVRTFNHGGRFEFLFGEVRSAQDVGEVGHEHFLWAW